MVIVLLAAAGLVVVATLIGHGAIGLCGWRGWQGWATGLGLAVLVVLGGQLALDRRLAVPIAVAALLLAALALARRESRQALAEIRVAQVWPAVVVLLGAAVPMLVAGHPGVFGAGISDDMSAHLLAADWLRTHDGLPPVAALGQPILGAGYPVGPHGVVAALRALAGVGEVDGFDALLLAVPVATTLAVQSVLPDTRGRGIVAALIGLSYLPAAYLAQSAFKETLVALFLLVAVALLDRLTRPDGAAPARLGLALAPLGAVGAGAAYVYGLPGVAWPLGATLALGAVLALRSGDVRGSLRRGVARRRGRRSRSRSCSARPDALRLGRFAHSGLEAGRAGGRGNLFHALNPLEATGVWFSSDFRVAPATAWPSLLGGALVVVALVAGLAWWWRERRLAVPSGLVAAGVIGAGVAWAATRTRRPRDSSCSRPLLLLAAAAPLLAAWRAGPLPGGARVRTVARVLGPSCSPARWHRARWPCAPRRSGSGRRRPSSRGCDRSCATARCSTWASTTTPSGICAAPTSTCRPPSTASRCSSRAASTRRPTTSATSRPTTSTTSRG